MSKVISGDYTIYEPEVGALEHELFYHGTGKRPASKIRIWRANSDPTPFGDVVFQGTLGELIEQLTTWPGVTA